MQDIMKKSLSYSTSLIYLQGIVRPQIMKQSSELAHLSLSGLKSRLIEYFKEYPNAQFKLIPVRNKFSISKFCTK